jgi:hypothetical protein
VGIILKFIFRAVSDAFSIFLMNQYDDFLKKTLIWFTGEWSAAFSIFNDKF